MIYCVRLLFSNFFISKTLFFFLNKREKMIGNTVSHDNNWCQLTRLTRQHSSYLLIYYLTYDFFKKNFHTNTFKIFHFSLTKVIYFDIIY